MVNLALFGLYAFGVVFALGLIAIFGWWLFDQRRVWVCVFNDGTGESNFIKVRPKDNQLTVKDPSSGDKVNVELVPGFSQFKKGFRAGPLFYVNARTMEVVRPVQAQSRGDGPEWEFQPMTGRMAAAYFSARLQREWRHGEANMWESLSRVAIIALVPITLIILWSVVKT